MQQEEQKKLALILQHQQELSTALVEEQERERARIAGELHDDLITNLYRIKLSSEDEKVKSLLTESIQRARKLSHELSPPLLEALDMETLLVDFLEPFQQQYNIQITFKHSNNQRLNTSSKLQLFRIVQEVLTNINKHAAATAIEVTYRFQERYCCLMIKDNGVGLPNNKTSGLGLKNITLRAQILKGRYQLKNNQPRGTTFIFLRQEQAQKVS